MDQIKNAKRWLDLPSCEKVYLPVIRRSYAKLFLRKPNQEKIHEVLRYLNYNFDEDGYNSENMEFWIKTILHIKPHYSKDDVLAKLQSWKECTDTKNLVTGSFVNFCYYAFNFIEALDCNSHKEQCLKNAGQLTLK